MRAYTRIPARIRTLPRILSALPGGTQIVPATASRTGRLFPAAAPSDMKLSKLKCRPDTNTGPNTGHPEPRKAPKPPDRSAPDTNISPNKNAARIRTSPRAQTPARTGKDNRPPSPITPNTDTAPDTKKPARKVRDLPGWRMRPDENLYLSILVIMKRSAPRSRPRPAGCRSINIRLQY